MSHNSLPFWKDYPERDNEWVRQYPTRHHALSEADVFTTQPMGFYMHIPFCNRLCFSCPYIKHQTDKSVTQRYVEALKREMSLYAARPYVQDHRLEVGYIGGGTPTALSSEQLTEVLRHLRSEFSTLPGMEITVESTPLDISEHKARTLLAEGVNRISLGVQTFVEQELVDIGRPADVAMITEAIRMLHRIGVPRVNIDLMHGLNGQTMDSWHHSLQTAVDLGVSSISFYTYMEFAQVSTKRRKLPPVPPREQVDEMFLYAAEFLTGQGYEGYFGDCFALPGQRPDYGARTWTEEFPIIPLGPTATGHLKSHWYFNEPDIERYMQQVNAGQLPLSMGREISAEERLRRAVVLGIKSSRLSRQRYLAQHGVDFAKLFADEIATLQAQGLVRLTDEALEVTGPKGWYYMDNISKAFYSPPHRRYPQHLGADISPFMRIQAA
ncbi:coproporphyrinogen-III oxidase family protein [Roseateles sp. BYS180W]|uniref:Coproporphyrinogen-III oxidase family protein n=1 Tax=Roseateles rivi TaxID=3299028 RepID=A0ABW7FU65_9BURK